MSEIEAEVIVRIPGSWSSFEHLEVSLTLDELILLYETIQDVTHKDRSFVASLKGINLDEPTKASSGEEGAPASFEEIKARAAAKLRGQSVDEMEFGDIGFGFVEAD